MMAPDMRSPATALQSGDRAKGNRNEAFSNIASHEPKADFVAAYVARRYRLPLSTARIVAALANLGGRIG
jgi:hypothetical protein